MAFIVESMGFIKPTPLVSDCVDCAVCAMLLWIERFWVPPLLCPEVYSLFIDSGELLGSARSLDILTKRNMRRIYWGF